MLTLLELSKKPERNGDSQVSLLVQKSRGAQGRVDIEGQTSDNLHRHTPARKGGRLLQFSKPFTR